MKQRHLAPVAVDDQRTAGECRLDEPRNHHPVASRFSGPDDVEHPADDDRQAMLTPVGQGQKLVDRLGDARRPARPAGGAKDQVVLFVPDFFPVLAVNLARAGQKQFGGVSRLAAAQHFGQHQLGRIEIGFDRVDRRAGDQLDADGRRQVIDFVDVGHQAAHERLVGGRTADVGELEMAAHGSQVFRRAGRLVVQHGHVVIAGQQGFGQMAADKARPAGDQSMLHTHTRISRTRG